jgi:archaellum biogenesis protein FlaJ (TadC family)
MLNVSPETIIASQNVIGMSMNPLFGTQTFAVRGFAGKNRVNVGLVIQKIPKTDNYYLSIIKDNGKHTSSYSITGKKLKKIVANDFWVLTDKKFN